MLLVILNLDMKVCLFYSKIFNLVIVIILNNIFLKFVDLV